MSHQNVAPMTAATHQSQSLRSRGPGARVTSHHTGRMRVTPVAAALTPPTQSRASPDSPAARRSDPSREPRTSGSSTHGVSAIGHASAETAPSSLTIRGASA